MINSLEKPMLCIIKNETDNEIINTLSINTLSKQIKSGGAILLANRNQDNVRYVSASLNLDDGNEYLLSNKLISATFIVNFKTKLYGTTPGFNNDKEIIFTYTSKCYYQLPEIPNPNEVENNAKGETRSTKVESTPIVEVDSVDLDNDER